jgi:broad specificity phosphatase PhoE
MRIFLIRHGQSLGNDDRTYYLTHPDNKIPLSQRGEKDCVESYKKIREIMDKLDEPKVALGYPRENSLFNIIHSTFKRATQSANIIYDCLRNDPWCIAGNMTPSALCTERRWGELRNLSMQKKLDSIVHFDFYYKPIDGESLHETSMVVIGTKIQKQHHCCTWRIQ